jgi:hypothetical protein
LFFALLEFRCSIPDLSVLPTKWLEACLDRLSAQGQVRDDIIRRSAGLPFGLGALFQVSEAKNCIVRLVLLEGCATLFSVYKQNLFISHHASSDDVHLSATVTHV